MKPVFFSVLPRAAVILIAAFALRGTAQEAPADKPAPSPVAPPAAPAAPAEVAPAAPPPPAVAESEPAVPERKGLRRLDVPVTPRKVESSGKRRTDDRRGGGNQAPFGSHVIVKGSTSREAVSIFGSTRVDGEIPGDAVAVFGDTTIGAGAKVGGAAVAVFGKLDSQGEIRGEAVSVLGSMTLNGLVQGEAVVVFGNLNLGPNAVVNGDLVVIGGKLTRDPAAIVRGDLVNVPLLGAFGEGEWLTSWLRRCLLLGRPLAFGENLGWAWGVAGAFLALYLLLALLFGRPIEKCVETLESRPGFSVLAAVLTVLLTPVALVLLALTLVGAVLVPFVGFGLFLAGLFGKAVMLAWIGGRVAKLSGSRVPVQPVVAVLIGGVLVMLLYTVWGSFLLYKLLSWLGLGVVVYTIVLAIRRDRSAAAAAPTTSVPPAPPSDPVSPPPAPAAAGAVPLTSSGFAGRDADIPPAAAAFPAPPAEAAGFVAAGTPVPPPSAAPSPPPLPPLVPASAAVPPPVSMISSLTLPRAGFLLRLAALALDGILVGMLVGFASGILPRFLQFHHGPGGVLMALAIYGAVMWKTRGTTIGGIVCGLKVVRLDQRELDWATAIVRALGCFLSLVVAGLGFIWVVFDDEKQSWHDKIAGTTVVRVPKGVSLL